MGLNIRYPSTTEGPNSPYAYCEYECDDHIHIVPVFGALEIEEAAEMLAGAVRTCGAQRGGVHGNGHDPRHEQLAFDAAREQLTTRDFNAEWAIMKQKQRAHRLWGGPVPAAVVLPKPNGSMDLIIPNKEGVPYMYQVREDVAKDLSDIIPPPNPSNSVEAPIGHYKRPRRRKGRH